jgi:hypothetical protein
VLLVGAGTVVVVVGAAVDDVVVVELDVEVELESDPVARPDAAVRGGAVGDVESLASLDDPPQAATSVTNTSALAVAASR